AITADCRQARRLIDQLLGDATPKEIEAGVPIYRETLGAHRGTISILMNPDRAIVPPHLPDNMNDNRIINALANLQSLHKERQIILVSKDINMRLKARARAGAAQD